MPKRTQLELLVPTIKTLTTSKNGVTIRELSIKSGVSWRFAKKTVEAFHKASMIKVIKNGKKRFKFIQNSIE